MVHGSIERRRRGSARTVWRSAGAWRVAAAAAAAVAAIAIVAGTRGGGFSQQQQIALQAAPGWAVRGDAQLGRQAGREVVRVRISGLHRLADNGYYELWLAKNPQDRVSLGAVQLSGDGTTIDASIPVPALESGYKGVWLTAEPDDHDPAWSKNWVVKARFA
jgi:anti-sigma-K factor RskA